LAIDSLLPLKRALVKEVAASQEETLGAEPERRIAAVALVFSPTEEGLSVCMIRRAEHPDDPWSGHMAFPGGRREVDDVDSLGTAIRETNEEIGVSLSREQCLGALKPVFVPVSLGVGAMTIEAFVFGLDSPLSPTGNAEVAAVYQFPLTQLLTPEGRGNFEYKHRGGTVTLQCLDLQECRIWGLSLRILDYLLEKLSAVD
jgi:8-oxo-dGTP pyrophosphatase MutT (NUDIX family)